MSRRFQRIGLIGDIHAEDQRLALALEVLASRGVELVAATGDVAAGVGSLDRCCALLEAHRAVVVRGNHDRWLLAGTARELTDATPADAVTAETRHMLAQLPEMVEFETAGGRALLCHGLGPNDMAKVTPDDTDYALESNDDLQNLLRFGGYRWILNGHSHRRMVRHMSGVTLINAGTLKRGHEPCFLALDFAAGAAVVFTFNRSGQVDATTEEIALEDSPTSQRR